MPRNQTLGLFFMNEVHCEMRNSCCLKSLGFKIPHLFLVSLSCLIFTVGVLYLLWLACNITNVTYFFFNLIVKIRIYHGNIITWIQQLATSINCFSISGYNQSKLRTPLEHFLFTKKNLNLKWRKNILQK